MKENAERHKSQTPPPPPTTIIVIIIIRRIGEWCHDNVDNSNK